MQYWRVFNQRHTVSLLLIASVEWCEEACELLSSMHSNYHAHLNHQSDAANHIKRARLARRRRAREVNEHNEGHYPLHFSQPGAISAVPDSSTVTIPVRPATIELCAAPPSHSYSLVSC